MSSAPPVIDPPVVDPPVVDPPAVDPPVVDPAPGKTFTQADVDDIINKRLARERKKLEDELQTLKERGDLDEVDRLKAEMADKDAALSAKDLEVLNTKIETRAERSAVLAGVKPERVERFLAVAKLDIDELHTDGKPDGDAINAAVAKALADWPEFKGGTGNGTTSTGADFTGADNGNGKVWTRAEVEKLSAEQFATHEAEIMAQMQAGKIK